MLNVNGDGTNQDTLLCCRVWSGPRAVCRPEPRLHLHTSWFVSWSLSHRSRSTDSMTTTHPKAHALQTPAGTMHKQTHKMGMRSRENGVGGGEGCHVAGEEGLENEREIKI